MMPASSAGTHACECPGRELCRSLPSNQRRQVRENSIVRICFCFADAGSTEPAEQIQVFTASKAGLRRYRAAFGASRCAASDFAVSSGSPKVSKPARVGNLTPEAKFSVKPSAKIPLSAVSTTPAQDSPDVKLLCFVWTPRRKHDEEMMPEVERQLSGCDKHLFFTDMDAPGEPAENIIKVNITKQEKDRSDKDWLYHRNMVGLMQTWDHLIKNNIAIQYDWVINTELDHYVSPTRVRATIQSYKDLLKEGSERDRKAVNGPLMFSFGNAFAFNRKLIQYLADHWQVLSRIATEKNPGRGCPLFLLYQPEFPLHCSQDMAYPALMDSVLRLPSYGMPGCGQPDARNGKGVYFRLGCFEMHTSPFKQNEEGQNQTLQEIAAMRHCKTKAEAEAHWKRFEGQTNIEKKWEIFFLSREVPIIHHISSPNILRQARELLG